MNLVVLAGKEQGKKNNLSKQLKGVKSDLATLQRAKDRPGSMKRVFRPEIIVVANCISQ